MNSVARTFTDLAGLDRYLVELRSVLPYCNQEVIRVDIYVQFQPKEDSNGQTGEAEQEVCTEEGSDSEYARRY